MTTETVEVAYLQNLNSGECHRLLVDEAGKLRPLEPCNVDDIEHGERITKEEAAALPVKDRCGHCWSGTRGGSD